MTQANARAARTYRRPHPHMAGMTLVEMLVAMTCTILLMLAITQVFANMGDVSAKGRAGIEMSTQLRGTWLRLKEDLEGVTVPVRPWADADGAAGYFEIYDGTVTRDSTAPLSANTSIAANNLFGDVDDIICMTVRSNGAPFVGRYGTTMIESQVAEVIWWTSYSEPGAVTNSLSPTDAMAAGKPLTLHRRVLLVRPDLNAANGIYSGDSLLNHYQTNDISVHYTPNGLVANSLSDLSQRENRFAHHAVGANPAFPGPLAISNAYLLADYVLSGARTGEDVMLTSVIGFDIRVFDKNAVVETQTGEPVAPGDIAFNGSDNTLYLARGAFVDLLHGTIGDFGTTNTPPGAVGIGNVPVYDTWSYFYEHDGIAQGGGIVDRATNGLDDGGVGGAVDDA
ncbi:MAG TPA: hypothetical protein VL096_11655, partial [Pirellulaceae bacterium]|nr:hypothetical protein [Pirellulaceae bacterium]